MDELSNLEENCTSALRVANDLETRRRELRREICDLEIECNRAESEAQVAVELFAKASCRRLTEQLFVNLPRELRDVVYLHLLPQGPVKPPDYRPLSRRLSDISDYTVDMLPKYLGDVEYVSRSFSTELCEVYYRLSIFEFDGLHNIHVFRTMDVWGLGFAPVDFIMNVAVSIYCEDYGFTDIQIADPNIHAASGWANAPRFPGSMIQSCKRDLENLFGFKTGTKITITLLVDSTSLNGPLEKEEWQCKAVLPILFPTLHRLVVAGSKVAVRLGENECELPIRNEKVTLDELQESFAKDQKVAQQSNMFAE